MLEQNAKAANGKHMLNMCFARRSW